MWCLRPAPWFRSGRGIRTDHDLRRANLSARENVDDWRSCRQGTGCRPRRRRHHERHVGGVSEGARTFAQHRDVRDARRSGPGELQRLEQRRHRPCRELRAELHARAQRWKHRHFRGVASQCGVRPVATALVLSGEEAGDRGPAILHPSGPAYELRARRSERCVSPQALQKRCRRITATRAWNIPRTSAI